MSFTEKELDRDLSRLLNQSILVITFDGLNPKWVTVSGGRHQLTYKIGHTFTTHPKFPDSIHETLTHKLRDILQQAGYTSQDTDRVDAILDREMGEICITIPDIIFESRKTMLAELRASIKDTLRTGGS